MAPGRGWAVLALVLLAGCGAKDAARPPTASRSASLPPDQQDAETLGRELFELVDRAVDYRGSHRGRPAASLPPDGHRQPDARPPSAAW